MGREHVTGVGGVFIRAAHSTELAAWYAEHLGISQESGGAFQAAEGDVTVWALFPEDTDYFGPSGQQQMVNFRVRDLDAMLAELRAAGVEVVDDVQDAEFGRFGWAVDPEGNRFELWEPR
jgi:predicted enzyme related to lactoylglutathione lyase